MSYSGANNVIAKLRGKSLRESFVGKLREDESEDSEESEVYEEHPVDWNKNTLSDEQSESILSALSDKCDSASVVEDWRCLLVIECVSEKVARFTFDTEVKEGEPYIHAHGLVKDGDIWACRIDLSEKLDGLDLKDFASRLYDKAFEGL